MVDGEELPIDDPTIVARLQSDVVDKVQVYDKKSDQATFTGIDDGQRTKTIDLKLKEDKKKDISESSPLAATRATIEQHRHVQRIQKETQDFSLWHHEQHRKTGLDWNENMNYGGNGGFESVFLTMAAICISWSTTKMNSRFKLQ